MAILKYEILNPAKSNKKAFYDNKKNLLYIPIKNNYRYYVECALTNEYNGSREYYILLGKAKFDDNCRLCNTDQYGRCRIKLNGELKEYIIEESKNRGNVDVEYVESDEHYDVFSVI